MQALHPIGGSISNGCTSTIVHVGLQGTEAGKVDDDRRSFPASMAEQDEISGSHFPLCFMQVIMPAINAATAVAVVAYVGFYFWLEEAQVCALL